MHINLHGQPNRRTLVLVYLGCIAIPFAVAAVAYLFRAVLTEAAASTAVVAPSKPTTPRPVALQAGEANAPLGIATPPKAPELGTSPNANALHLGK